MKPIITVHRGELLQIKRMIENGDLRGDMYGLRTESRQPVIQFVCGENNKSNNTTERESTCQDMLKNRHGLLKLGEWVVSKRNVSRKDVVLLFNKEGELIFAEDRGQEGTTDILKGQSAFRLYEPLTKVLPDLSVPIPTEEYDKENENKEAEVTKEQWYSQPDGVKLLQGIYTTFPQNGLMILNMSRDKATEDISLSLDVDSMPIAVYFPAFFPYEYSKVRVDGENDWSEVELQYEEGMQPEEAAHRLCDRLLNLVNEQIEKKQQQKRSNKNRDRRSNKQNQKEKEIRMSKKSQPNSAQEKHQSTGYAQLNQDEASTGQKQPQLKDDTKPDQDETSTGKTPSPSMGDAQPNQDETSIGKTPPPTMGDAQPNQDKTSTGQKQPPSMGNTQPDQDETVTGQKQPPSMGNTQPDQDETVTGQKQPPSMGNTQPDQDETVTGQKQPPSMGDAQPDQDETVTGQKQPPSMGNTQPDQDETSTRQKQPLCIGDTQSNQDAPSTGHVSTPIINEAVLFVQNPEEKMDISESSVENLQETGEENMEVDGEDHQGFVTTTL